MVEMHFLEACFKCFYLRLIYLFERQSYEEKEIEPETKRDLRSADSLPQWPQQPELGQA